MNARGFTLLELLVIIVAVNVFTLVALPHFQDHLVAVRKANTQDTSYHNTGLCMHWQDPLLERHSHCRRKV